MGQDPLDFFPKVAVAALVVLGIIVLIAVLID